MYITGKRTEIKWTRTEWLGSSFIPIQPPVPPYGDYPRQITIGKPLLKKHKDGTKRFFQRVPITGWGGRNLIVYGVCVCVCGGGGGGGVGGEHKWKTVQVKLRTSRALHKKNCRSLPTLKGLHTPSVMWLRISFCVCSSAVKDKFC